MIYYVYAYLRNTDSATAPKGAPYYIGKGNGRRSIGDHGRVPVPTNESDIVFLKENIQEHEAHEYEIELIAHYGRKDLGTGILLNRTNGGEGGSGHIQIPWNKGLTGVQVPWNKGLTKEVNERIAKIADDLKGIRKGIPQSAETLAKRSAAMIGKNKGKVRTDEWKKNHSAKMKGRPSPLKGSPSPLKGRIGIVHSDETKKKMQLAKKGKPWTQARRDAHNKRTHNE